MYCITASYGYKPEFRELNERLSFLQDLVLEKAKLNKDVFVRKCSEYLRINQNYIS
jgi:hypothetical protein